MKQCSWAHFFSKKEEWILVMDVFFFLSFVVHSRISRNGFINGSFTVELCRNNAKMVSHSLLIRLLLAQA